MFDPTPLQNFMSRVQQAAKMNAKDIRLTASEGLEISACLVQILAAHVAMTSDKKQTTPTKKILGGGHLSERK